jgi:hypothetical protein
MGCEVVYDHCARWSSWPYTYGLFSNLRPYIAFVVELIAPHSYIERHPCHLPVPKARMTWRAESAMYPEMAKPTCVALVDIGLLGTDGETLIGTSHAIGGGARELNGLQSGGGSAQSWTVEL